MHAFARVTHYYCKSNDLKKTKLNKHIYTLLLPTAVATREQIISLYIASAYMQADVCLLYILMNWTKMMEA